MDCLFVRMLQFGAMTATLGELVGCVLLFLIEGNNLGS